MHIGEQQQHWHAFMLGSSLENFIIARYCITRKYVMDQNCCRKLSERLKVVHVGVTQSSSKKVITKEEWEKKLSEVKIRKEDVNRLVMNYLVTEGYVEAAEKFQHESGTQRILLSLCIIISTLSTPTMVGRGMSRS